MVYDETFVRHWDTWRGPKRSSLFVVGLGKESNEDGEGKWVLGETFEAPLKGTKHVRVLGVFPCSFPSLIHTIWPLACPC